MRISLIAVISAGSMLATTATAQVIPGIRIGQPKAEALTVFGGRASPVVGQAGLEIASRADGHVTFCNGSVSSIQRTIGHDLHAFTDTVNDIRREYGDPTYTPRHLRTSDGEVSTIDAQWDYSDDDRRYTIGMIYSGSNLTVTETISLLTGERCGG
nr:hypothetical protein [Brevundimonas diminuta]